MNKCWINVRDEKLWRVTCKRTVGFWARSLSDRFPLNQSRSKRSITKRNVQIIVSMTVDLTALMVASGPVLWSWSTCSFYAASAWNPSNRAASRTIWERGKTSVRDLPWRTRHIWGNRLRLQLIFLWEKRPLASEVVYGVYLHGYAAVS